MLSAEGLQALLKVREAGPYLLLVTDSEDRQIEYCPPHAGHGT